MILKLTAYCLLLFYSKFLNFPKFIPAISDVEKSSAINQLF